jgi:hypothetical protein
MTPIVLTQVIDCLGATVRNDRLQPTSDPPLTLSLKAKGKQIYVLPYRSGELCGSWKYCLLGVKGDVLAKGPPVR